MVDEDARGQRALLVAAVCLVAANMRVSIAAVGPLVEQIRAETGLSAAMLGFLAAVPLIAWALVSPLAHALSRRLGLSATVLWSMVLLALGTAARALPGPQASLWIGTVVIGVALAVANVLMPAVIKRDFPDRIAAMTSVYTALLSTVGAVVSGLVVPISLIPIGGHPAGWRFGMLIAGALLPLAIVLWAVAERRRLGRDLPRAAAPGGASGASGGPVAPAPGSASAPAVGRRTVWRDGVAWLVAAYMGLQSITFYMLVTWLSPMSISRGASETLAGVEVMLFQTFGILGSFVVPLLQRTRLGRRLPALLPVAATAFALGLTFQPGAVIVWVSLASFVGGATLSMSYTLVAQRAADHAVATALSGMSQGVGYAIAAVGPVAFGWLHDVTGSWTPPLLVMTGLYAVLVVVGLLLSDDRRVFEPRSR